jgi:hypothetical protein
MSAENRPARTIVVLTNGHKLETTWAEETLDQEITRSGDHFAIKMRARVAGQVMWKTINVMAPSISYFYANPDQA